MIYKIKNKIWNWWMENDIQILEALVYCYHTGVDILDYSSTKEQLRK